MEYDAVKLRINAYGEHVDTELRRRITAKTGCVDISVRDITSALRVPTDNVVLDPDKSLPLNTLRRVIQRVGPYKEHAYENSPLYTTAAQLEQSHQW